ncbi:MAG: pyridoxal kinase PdxY [Nocardioides sp.]|uniref:pyridoxal kinase PdxY n=1 Tax=Nocardioides sp. TaxID=35761 RepID=UPI0039E332ED
MSSHEAGSVLSVQSHVAFGYVGNSAAVFPLQRLGHEVWPVLTVNFSNHTGYGEWRGPVLPASDVASVIEGIAERGVLPGVAAVLSGYQGDAGVGEVVLDAVRRVKAANPSAIYACDPVMGDVDRGMFVRPGIPELMRDSVVPAADVITPNHFELNFLAGVEATPTLSSVLAAVDAVRAAGPSNVLVTSVLVGGDPDSLDLVAVDDDGAWAVTTPLLPITPNGGGDVTTAVYLAHLLSSGSTPVALERTANTLFAILARTLESGRRELELVASQDDIASPPTRFAARRLR